MDKRQRTSVTWRLSNYLSDGSVKKVLHNEEKIHQLLGHFSKSRELLDVILSASVEQKKDVKNPNFIQPYNWDYCVMCKEEKNEDTPGCDDDMAQRQCEKLRMDLATKFHEAYTASKRPFNWYTWTDEYKATEKLELLALSMWGTPRIRKDYVKSIIEGDIFKNKIIAPGILETVFNCRGARVQRGAVDEGAGASILLRIWRSFRMIEKDNFPFSLFNQSEMHEILSNLDPIDQITLLIEKLNECMSDACASDGRMATVLSPNGQKIVNQMLNHQAEISKKLEEKMTWSGAEGQKLIVNVKKTSYGLHRP